MRITHDWIVRNLDIGTESELVTNPYSGQSVTLEPEAVALYDWIKGSEMFGRYDNVRAGLDYFRRKWGPEYMILLD